jgi:hypothetical protein
VIQGGVVLTKTAEGAALAKRIKIGQALTAGLVGGSQEGSGTYQQLKQLGADDKTAAKGFAAMTAASGILASFQFERVLSMFAGEGNKVAQMALNALMEGTTEAIEEPADFTIRKMLGYIQQDETIISALKQGATAFFPAMLMGPAFEGLRSSGRFVKEQAEAKKAQSDAVTKPEPLISPLLSKATEETLAIENSDAAEQHRQAVFSADSPQILAKFGHDVKYVEQNDPMFTDPKNSDTKAMANMVRVWGSTIQRPVIFIEGIEDNPGFEVPGGGIYLNRNTPDSWFMETFMHENSHGMDRLAEAAAKGFKGNPKDVELKELLDSVVTFASDHKDFKQIYAAIKDIHHRRGRRRNRPRQGNR